jgi:hypothetical protein
MPNTSTTSGASTLDEGADEGAPDDGATKEAGATDDESVAVERAEEETGPASIGTDADTSHGEPVQETDVGASSADGTAVARGEKSNGDDEEDGDG